MKLFSSPRRMAGAAALAAGLFAVACDTADQSPTGIDPNLAVGDYVYDEITVRPGVGLVCAFYPDDTFTGPSTFTASATGGDVFAGQFDIEPAPNCFEAWNATDDASVLFSASLVDNPENLVLDRIATLVGPEPVVTFYYDVTSAIAAVNDQVGANIWFKFKEQDVPDSGGEGCTPGYWRQEQHFDSWTGYAPGDLFSSVFADAFPGETLLDVVWARGGGLNALGRHAVAALLNAASDGVDYDYTVTEVIEAFNAAYASGDASTIENQKNVFDFLNNQGCGLN